MSHTVSTGLATHRIKVEGTIHTRAELDAMIVALLDAGRVLRWQARDQHKARQF